MAGMRFGPGGTGSPAIEGIREIASKGLDCVEVEFTYTVWMKDKAAEEFGKVARDLGLSLSIHAPYFVNLASAEKHKIIASKNRILSCCESAQQMGFSQEKEPIYIVFHAAFYGKMEHESCYQQVKKEVFDMMKTMKKNGWDVPVLCPETTGKGSQFGTYQELVRLSQETGCGVCVDFAHIYARDDGKIDYDDVMKTIKNARHLTCHFSGIEYTAKGERRHKLTPVDKIEELFKYAKKYKMDLRIINESPEPLKDAIKMKKLWK